MTTDFETPMMTLRGTTMFPGAEMAIHVGREHTMASVRRAQKYFGGKLAVFTQLRAEDDDPIGPDSLYKIGTLCTIEAMIELQDESMKLSLCGHERVRLLGIQKDADKSIIARFAPQPLRSDIIHSYIVSPAERDALCRAIAQWNLPLASEPDHAEWQALCAAQDIGTAARLARRITCSPRFPNGKTTINAITCSEDDAAHALQDRINEAVSLRQRILEEDDPYRQLTLIHAAVAFDLRC